MNAPSSGKITQSNTGFCLDDTLNNWPDNDSGFSVPYSLFTEGEVYRAEQERLFRGESWSFVALEQEIPNSGDFKATFIGDTPVIVMRDQDGHVNVVVNRCAHRGAKVCRSLRGNVAHLECVYHSWAFDLKGDLIGVPFRRGLKGKGGMPETFDMKEHSLKKLRVSTIQGLVFASFSQSVVDLETFLGPMVCTAIRRIFNRPIKILGDERQRIHGNWKLYAENTRDPYHASLLHLFHTTFGLYRSTQVGGTYMDANHCHSMLTAKAGSSSASEDAEAYSDQRAFNSEFTLQDMSLLKGRLEFDDEVTLVILTLFPNLVVQQIANTLAVRQIVTYGPKEFELVWTSFGYQDDDDEMQEMRIKQNNLIGPAGLISMEDGEAVEIVHNGIVREQNDCSYIAMGGGRAEDVDHLVSENSIIGFWEFYRRVMRGEQKINLT